jgi:hypothetical protein
MWGLWGVGLETWRGDGADGLALRLEELTELGRGGNEVCIGRGCDEIIWERGCVEEIIELL